MEKLKFAYDWCVGLIEANPAPTFWAWMLSLAGVALL
jgi:hypothetical protein